MTNIYSKLSLTLAGHPFVRHADDSLAAAILSLLFEKRGHYVTFVFSREPEVLAKADIRFDTGGKYLPEEGWFDHHFVGSPEYKDVRDQSGDPLKYAAAGLVWQYFGPDLVMQMHSDLKREQAVKLCDQVGASFVRAVDALDNGQLVSKPLFNGVKERGFSQIISQMNPGDSNGNRPTEDDYRFIFLNSMVPFAKGQLLAEIEDWVDVVRFEPQVAADFANSSGPDIIQLAKPGPWVRCVWSLGLPVKFCVFPGDEKTPWYVQTCPTGEDAPFSQRVPLRADFAGKRGKDLDAVAGIEGGVFVHPARFIGGAQTKEAATRLAELSLQA